MKRIFATISAAIFGTAAQAAPDNAGIFFYGTGPTVEQIIEASSGAKTSVERSPNKTVVIASWSDVSVTFNIDPNWNRDVQLNGIQGWLSSFPKELTDTPAASSFLTKLKDTTTCYGSVIQPKYDKAGKVSQTLLRLLKAGGGGFIFTHQSFYDQNGTKIIGASSGDPERLGSH